MRPNLPAQAFWRHTIAEYTNGALLNTNFTTKHGREGPAAAIVSDAQRQIIEGLWVV